MTTNKNNDGCCGYDSVAAQLADRQSFIEAANSATTIAELEEMASDVPYRWHNVSALPAAIAVQTRANALAGLQDPKFGFTVDDYGYLRRITGYDSCGCPILAPNKEDVENV